ncbi:MAG: hypothetical protein ACRDLF_10815 [Solirubrobacteraceae bacterium]
MFDQPDGVARGVFEPPSGFAVWAIARNKLVVFVVAVVLALAGVGVGAKRRSTYTASATVQVGQVNPNSPGFFGYSQSSATLANAFSRSIAAEPVLAAVQKKLKLAPAQAVARLSAEPIPEAPAFRVIATGSSELGAIDLANVAANAVIAYEGQSNSANPEAASLLEEYRAASLKLQQAVRAVGDLSRKKGASLEALARVEADRNAAAVRLKAIGVAYTSAVASQAPRSGLVSLLAGAASASSDRSSRVELYGFIGLLVGVVVGCFVAVLRERRRAASRRAAVRDEIERVEPVA